jgi:hypothetical protein
VRLQFFPHSIHVLLYMVYGLVRWYIEPPFVERQRRSSSCAIPGGVNIGGRYSPLQLTV